MPLLLPRLQGRKAQPREEARGTAGSGVPCGSLEVFEHGDVTKGCTREPAVRKLGPVRTEGSGRPGIV